MNKIFLSLIMANALISVAFAGGEVQIDDLKSSWGNPAMSYCLTSKVGNATIGEFKDKCVGNYNIEALSPSECVLGDDMGILMLVARDVNEYGARFCITTIYGEHKKQGEAWTLYAEPEQGPQPCFWLCKPGYSGDKCESTTPSGCDSTLLKRENFDKYRMARDPQVETTIPMFHWNVRRECWTQNRSSEHDMILAISDWLPSGHGAWASPFVIHSVRDRDKSNKGSISAWPAAEPTLLCKNGYTASADGQDCIAIDEAACALTNMCPNWPSNAFDESTMVLEYDDDQGCYRYKCIDAGYAFPSTTNRTCQLCTGNIRGGASPVDGTCVKCDIGKIFDQTAAASGYCVDTDAFSKSDLQYGKGKAKTSPLAEQCWMIPEATAYLNCVKGITTQQ